MDKFEAVRNMQEYIDNHINERITLNDLANVSLYSPWHSYRIFNEILGLTVSDYIRRLRLSKSALRLRDEKIKILDIAYEYGYDSVDGYQRAFHKEFMMNPYEYLKNPIPICLFIPYRKYDQKEKIKMSNVSNVFVSIVEKPERKVIIKRGVKADNYMDYCNEVGCDVWGILSSIKSISGEPVCLWLPKHLIKVETSEYVQGVEVASDYSGIVPEGFEIITLPKATYLQFNGEAFNEENYCEAIEALWQAMDKYNPANIGYKWDNTNPRIQLEPIGERGYIELKAICK